MKTEVLLSIILVTLLLGYLYYIDSTSYVASGINSQLSALTSPSEHKLIKVVKDVNQYCLSNRNINNQKSNDCEQCNDKNNSDMRQISCAYQKSKNYLCNPTFTKFFKELGISGFDQLYKESQYYTGNLPAFVVSGMNYKTYKDAADAAPKSHNGLGKTITMDMFKNVNNANTVKIISAILDYYANNEKIHVYTVQAPLSFTNFSTTGIIDELRTKAKMAHRENIKNLYNLLANSVENGTIKPGTVSGQDLGLYHSGLVFVKASDVPHDKSLQSSKIICSIELWGESILGGNLLGNILPQCDNEGNIIMKNVAETCIVTCIPQLFGCDPGEYWGEYWTSQYYLGQTTKDTVLQLFTNAHDWQQTYKYYIAQTVTNKVNPKTTECFNATYNNIIPAVTCETFVGEMIKQLTVLDPQSFSSNIIAQNRILFSDLVFEGDFEVFTQEDIKKDPKLYSAINYYTKNIDNDIKNMMNIFEGFIYSTICAPEYPQSDIPPPVPTEQPHIKPPDAVVGNILNHILGLVTGLIISVITNGKNAIYTLGYINNEVVVIKLHQTQNKPIDVGLKIDDCLPYSWYSTHGKK